MGSTHKGGAYLRSWIANNAEVIVPLLAIFCQNGVFPEAESDSHARPKIPDMGEVMKLDDNASTTAVVRNTINDWITNQTRHERTETLIRDGEARHDDGVFSEITRGLALAVLDEERGTQVLERR